MSNRPLNWQEIQIIKQITSILKSDAPWEMKRDKIERIRPTERIRNYLRWWHEYEKDYLESPEAVEDRKTRLLIIGKQDF